MLKRTDINIKNSYTAADSIPIKVLLDSDLISCARVNKRLIPVHIQILPTNRCNLNCNFCSCSKRNKMKELDFALAERIIIKCKNLGTKSVTITGGGEPLLYSNFDRLVTCFVKNGIKIGLVTNGLLLCRIEKTTLKNLTWCRISNDDSRSFNPAYMKNLEKVVSNNSNIDWAFSHVVSDMPNYMEIIKVVNFANKHNFTHVRLVADLFKPQAINMDKIKYRLNKENVDDRIVIYQGRKIYTNGGDCYIGYIKPLIGADAKVYACCGAQYALKNPTKDLPKELCLGEAIHLDKILERSYIPFNGGVCVKCYYMNYNSILEGILKDVAHREFI